MKTPLDKRLVAALVLAAAAVASGGARAEDGVSPTREAGKHFQRGVALYAEADYRAALVEFKRAYATAPNASVLYNVGETQYQLQDYAAALTTFERYLAESNPSDPHRGEVEGSVEVLRARVGHVSITTVPPGADVLIDDQSVGRTPLDRPLLVSVGHRKITASLLGHSTVTRFVDVATDDNLSVTVPLPSTVDGSSAAASTALAASAGAPESRSNTGAVLRTVGWVGTGALAAGAITFGVLAARASSNLRDARDTFPTTGATLAHDANLVTTYAVIADSLTAAAIVLGGVTVWSTLASTSASKPTHESAGSARVTLGPASARFDMSF
jgi:tetratricopeptide (TPR) repeat protein